MCGNGAVRDEMGFLSIEVPISFDLIFPLADWFINFPILSCIDNLGLIFIRRYQTVSAGNFCVRSIRNAANISRDTVQWK